MRHWIIFTALALVSVWSLAGHHGGGHDKGGMFKHADLDKNGSISLEEHEAAIQKMADKRRQKFNKMDADGDGAVTMEEAKAQRKEMHSKHMHKEPAE